MADYYPVLKRAIATLPDNTLEFRRAVYEKARLALTRQLNAFDPPLSTAELGEQRAALEESIRKVEAEEEGVVHGGRARTRTRREEEGEGGDPDPDPDRGRPDPGGGIAEGERAASMAATAASTAPAGSAAVPAPPARPAAASPRPAPAGRGSRLPALAATTVLFFIMAGVGAIAWDNRDRLFAGRGADALPATPAAVASDEPPKIEDRLPILGDTEVVGAPEEGATTIQAEPVPLGVILPQPAPQI